MAAPTGKASRTGALQPRAQKGRVRRAVRISSLVAQEVGVPPSFPLLPPTLMQVRRGSEGSDSRSGDGFRGAVVLWGEPRELWPGLSHSWLQLALLQCCRA